MKRRSSKAYVKRSETFPLPSKRPIANKSWRGMKVLLVFAVIWMFLLFTQPHAREEYIISNAQIYTVDELNPKVSTFVIKNGLFAEVGGTLEELQAKYPRAAVLDMKNKLITPGLIDSHAVNFEGISYLASYSQSYCHDNGQFGRMSQPSGSPFALARVFELKSAH
jgi:hypothetical protein